MTFDVASIRQSQIANSYDVSGSFAPHSTSLRVTNFDVWNLLIMAYGIRMDQIVGMPDLRGMFNIQAKADTIVDTRLASLPEDQEVLEQQHMLQVLLADRFKLKVHRQTREGLMYNLVVSRSGLKVGTTTGGLPSPEETKLWGDRPVPHIYQRGDSRTGFALIAHDCSMNDLAQSLAGQFAHPVSDKTGLTGRYDFTIRYLGTHQIDREEDDVNPVPPLDTAIYDQLGLKLERVKGLLEVLVVDHMENPTDN